jgi:16S rRNA processing protein RimM
VGEAVIIGVVTRAHGLHGMVRARATGPTLARLAAGEHVTVTDRDGRIHDLALVSQAPAGADLLIGFDAVADRADADALRGGTISIDAARLPDAVTPDEFYVRDLLGASVVVDGRAIGMVRDVINRPANDVLDVVGAEGASVLLPFTRDAVIAIDLAARRIELRAGLIDPLAGSDAGGGGGRDAG